MQSLRLLVWDFSSLPLLFLPLFFAWPRCEEKKTEANLSCPTERKKTFPCLLSAMRSAPVIFCRKRAGSAAPPFRWVPCHRGLSFTRERTRCPQFYLGCKETQISLQGSVGNSFMRGTGVRLCKVRQGSLHVIWGPAKEQRNGSRSVYFCCSSSFVLLAVQQPASSQLSFKPCQ